MMPFEIKNTLSDEKAFEMGDEDVQKQRCKEQIKDIRSFRVMREDYAAKAYRIALFTLSGWAIFVVLYLVCAIFFAVKGVLMTKFIPPSIFITITSACTVNIIAAFIAVVKGLFSLKTESSSSTKKE